MKTERKEEKMTTAALFPYLLLFLTSLSIGSGYTFNIATDLQASSKTVYSSGSGSFGYGLDASHDFNGDGFNDILMCSYPNSNPFCIFRGSFRPIDHSFSQIHRTSW
jgi:hypothetical protein